MTSFAGQSRVMSRRQPGNQRAAVTPRLSVGGSEPGVVNSGHFRPFDSSAFALDRAASAYIQAVTSDFTVGAGAAATPGWGAPIAAQRAAVQIGPTPVATTVFAHGSVGWRNNSGAAIHGRCCFTLYDGPAGQLGSLGRAFSRSIDIPSTRLPNDGAFYQLVTTALITVPYSDTADWHLVMSFQNDLASPSGSQALNRQKIVIFSAGPAPTFADTTVADGSLV